MTDIPNNVKVALINNQLAMWKNTYFDEEIKARVAKTLHDEQMLNSAKSQMQQALKAQNELEKIIQELEAQPSPNGRKNPVPREEPEKV